MKDCPVQYIREASFSGSLFDQDHHSGGAVSSINTGFYCDHKEPLAVLSRVKENMDWKLGELLEGHEFLLLIPTRKVSSTRKHYYQDLENGTIAIAI